MNTAAMQIPFSEDGPASKRIIVGYGFWIFLLSDIIMFSAFFAAYAVLSGATAGGPTSQQLFDLNNVAWETACLLLSSFTCGLASVAVARRNQLWAQVALLITGLLGLAFLLLEVHEFIGLINQGAGPTRSAFYPHFYARWLSWPAYHYRLVVARHHDGANLCQRF